MPHDEPELCSVCGTPIRGRNVYGAHGLCALVRQLGELTDAVLVLAESGVSPAALGPALDAVQQAAAAMTNEPATEAEPAKDEPSNDTAPAADTTADAGDTPAPAAAPPARRRPPIADVKSVAVVAPDWVQIGTDRYRFEVATAADIVRVAKALHHPASVPQVWLLAETCSKLGLEFYPTDVNASRSAQIEDMERQLRESTAGAEFLRPALESGWSCKGHVEPWTLLSQENRSSGGRLIHLVLEPYAWVYDDQENSITGAEGTETALDEDMQVRADQLIERIGWVSQHLGVLPDSNASRTMQRVFDVDRRQKLRKLKAGERATDKNGRARLRVVEGAGVVPEMDGRAGINQEVEPELLWYRRPTDHEIEQAEVALLLDQRAAYPASCSNLVLPLGEPRLLNAEEAIEISDRAETLFGLWRFVATDPWPEPRMFPIHPDLNRPGDIGWMTARVLSMALKPEDENGAGLTLGQLGITGAYVWENSGRMLEPWYETYRPARIAAEQISDPGLRGVMTTLVKEGGKGFIGKFSYVRPGQNTNRPWLHQHLWRQGIIGATRARLSRQTKAIARRHNVWPVYARTDAVLYLCSAEIADALVNEGGLAFDNGRNGILREESRREITAADRKRLARLESGNVMKVLELESNKDRKGR